MHQTTCFYFFYSIQFNLDSIYADPPVNNWENVKSLIESRVVLEDIETLDVVVYMIRSRISIAMGNGDIKEIEKLLDMAKKYSIKIEFVQERLDNLHRGQRYVHRDIQSKRKKSISLLDYVLYMDSTVSALFIFVPQAPLPILVEAVRTNNVRVLRLIFDTSIDHILCASSSSFHEETDLWNLKKRKYLDNDYRLRRLRYVYNHAFLDHFETRFEMFSALNALIIGAIDKRRKPNLNTFTGLEVLRMIWDLGIDSTESDENTGMGKSFLRILSEQYSWASRSRLSNPEQYSTEVMEHRRAIIARLVELTESDVRGSFVAAIEALSGQRVYDLIRDTSMKHIERTLRSLAASVFVPCASQTVALANKIDGLL